MRTTLNTKSHFFCSTPSSSTMVKRGKRGNAGRMRDAGNCERMRGNAKGRKKPQKEIEKLPNVYPMFYHVCPG